MEGRAIEPVGIGVGCLWFAQPLSDDPPSEKHFELVREKLLEIENLTDLSIEGIDGKYGSTVIFNDGEEYVYPNIYWVKVEFNLFIPKKVQERLDADCGVENIRFNIENHYHSPVAYISSTKHDENFDPSSSVILVRRYLEEKFENSDIKFGSIGPSPFHATFWSTAGKETSLNEITFDAGYRTYIFTFEGESKNPVGEFSSRYGDDLSLFYYLHNIRRKSLNLQSSIIDESQDLISDQGDQKFWRKILGYTSLGARYDAISRDIMHDSLYRNEMTSLLDDREEEDLIKSFSDIKIHFGELQRYSKNEPYSAAKSIISTAEMRRMNFLSNTSTLVSGLFGGIVGAILGSLLTFLLAGSNKL